MSMKRILFSILALFIFTSFSSCYKNDIQLETKSYVSENKNIIIEYPIIKNSCGNKFNEYIFGYISDIYKGIVGDEPENFDFEIKYSVCIIDDMVSVLFEGELNYSISAHPTNIVYSINYSLNDDKNITFDDFLSGKSKDDIVKSALSNDIISELYSENDILKYIERSDDFVSQVCYYRTFDGIYLTLPVPHAVGDYVKIKIL